jgi:hypothetical protein
LLLQVFASRLSVSGNAFVVPPELIAEGKEFRPAELIARERTVRAISALLALSSALGLALHYRDSLVAALRPPRSSSDESQCRVR